jgi:hypothetical protein
MLTFFLMFVIAAVATDTRAVGTMAGIAVSRCLRSDLNLQVVKLDFESPNLKAVNKCLAWL